MENLEHGHGIHPNWSPTCGLILDQIRQRRNNFVFLGSWTIDITIQILVLQSLSYLKASFVLDTICSMTFVQMEVASGSSWKFPSLVWYNINIDDVVHISDNEADCGEVICDHEGQYVLGFKVDRGKISVVNVELWGVFHGARLALDKGMNNTIVKTES